MTGLVRALDAAAADAVAMAQARLTMADIVRRAGGSLPAQPPLSPLLPLQSPSGLSPSAAGEPSGSSAGASATRSSTGTLPDDLPGTALLSRIVADAFSENPALYWIAITDRRGIVRMSNGLSGVGAVLPAVSVCALREGLDGRCDGASIDVGDERLLIDGLIDAGGDGVGYVVLSLPRIGRLSSRLADELALAEQANGETSRDETGPAGPLQRGDPTRPGLPAWVRMVWCGAVLMGIVLCATAAAPHRIDVSERKAGGNARGRRSPPPMPDATRGAYRIMAARLAALTRLSPLSQLSHRSPGTTQTAASHRPAHPAAAAAAYAVPFMFASGCGLLAAALAVAVAWQGAERRDLTSHYLRYRYAEQVARMVAERLVGTEQHGVPWSTVETAMAVTSTAAAGAFTHTAAHTVMNPATPAESSVTKPAIVSALGIWQARTGVFGLALRDMRGRLLGANIARAHAADYVDERMPGAAQSAHAALFADTFTPVHCANGNFDAYLETHLLCAPVRDATGNTIGRLYVVTAAEVPAGPWQETLWPASFDPARQRAWLAILCGLILAVALSCAETFCYARRARPMLRAAVLAQATAQVERHDFRFVLYGAPRRAWDSRAQHIVQRMQHLVERQQQRVRMVQSLNRTESDALRVAEREQALSAACTGAMFPAFPASMPLRCRVVPVRAQSRVLGVLTGAGCGAALAAALAAVLTAGDGRFAPVWCLAMLLGYGLSSLHARRSNTAPPLIDEGEPRCNSPLSTGSVPIVRSVARVWSVASVALAVGGTACMAMTLALRWPGALRWLAGNATTFTTMAVFRASAALPTLVVIMIFAMLVMGWGMHRMVGHGDHAIAMTARDPAFSDAGGRGTVRGGLLCGVCVIGPGWAAALLAADAGPMMSLLPALLCALSSMPCAAAVLVWHWRRRTSPWTASTGTRALHVEDA